MTTSDQLPPAVTFPSEPEALSLPSEAVDESVVAAPAIGASIPKRVIQLGCYVVGEAPDPRLSGHPAIRY